MPDLPPLVYWDACVFLSLVNKVQDRLPILEESIAQMEKGNLRIATSTLSIVEVSFVAAEKAGRTLNPDEEKRLAGLWDPPTEMLDFHPQIAEEARRLLRLAMSNTWSLRPMDAIHIASALRNSIGTFHTYDDKLLARPSEYGLRICEPEALQTRLVIGP